MPETRKKPLISTPNKFLKLAKELRDLGVQEFSITPDGTVAVKFSVTAAQIAMADAKPVPPEYVAAIAHNPPKDLRVLNRPVNKLFGSKR
jgi:hypothetical protein